MNGPQPRAVGWAVYAATVVLVGVGIVAAAGGGSAQPLPVDPAVPPPPPPPAGAPYVPLIPGNEVLQQPGQMIGELGSLDLNTLFPLPAAPPTPVREMPMGPPPPPDPRFFPPPA